MTLDMNVSTVFAGSVENRSRSQRGTFIRLRHVCASSTAHARAYTSTYVYIPYAENIHMYIHHRRKIRFIDVPMCLMSVTR